MSRSLYPPVRIRRLYIEAINDAEFVRNKIKRAMDEKNK